MMSRLETMALSAAALPLLVIRQQIASALDIIVHLARLRDGSRKVMEICEMVGVEGGEVFLSPLYVFTEQGEAEGKICGRLEPRFQLNNRWKLAIAGLSWEGEDGREEDVSIHSRCEATG